MRFVRSSLSPKPSSPLSPKPRKQRSVSLPKTPRLSKSELNLRSRSTSSSHPRLPADQSFTSYNASIHEIRASLPPPPPSNWLPKDGKIVVKFRVEETDDLWKIRVKEGASLMEFSRAVKEKLGCYMLFTDSERCWDPASYVDTDVKFQRWVNGRIRHGRNWPIYAWKGE